MSVYVASNAYLSKPTPRSATFLAWAFRRLTVRSYLLSYWASPEFGETSNSTATVMKVEL